LLGEEILGPDGTDFRLSLTQNFSVREDDRENYGPYRVHTTKYIYELFDGEERVFGYHWHPDRTPDRQYPHFHLWAGATRLLSEQHDPHIPILRDAHIPTGRIAIEDVLWLLIADFHVHSYVTHWKKRLRKNRKSFEDWKSW
jgi:hypothetical protein